jgi:hypothetical protein
MELYEIEKVFMEHGFVPGRMVSGSKSGYSSQYPTHLVVFNSNVVTMEHGKIWYGDLDLTIDYKKLKEIAEELHVRLYVLYEMDGRFEYEECPKIERAVWDTNKKGQPKKGERK